jgi:hypothetical protein
VTLTVLAHRPGTLGAMTRTRTLLLAVSAAALVGLTACGATGPSTDASDPVTVAQTDALSAMGFDVDGVVAATPDATAAPGAAPSADAAHKAARKGLGKAMLRKNTLHAEAVVKTKDGTKTVVVQRGAVTAIDDKTVSVKSTDGFTLTWTFGNPIRVVERRNTVQPSAIKVGAQIGVAGSRDGSTTTARRVVITP